MKGYNSDKIIITIWCPSFYRASVKTSQLMFKRTRTVTRKPSIPKIKLIFHSSMIVFTADSGGKYGVVFEEIPQLMIVEM